MSWKTRDGATSNESLAGPASGAGAWGLTTPEALDTVNRCRNALVNLNDQRFDWARVRNATDAPHAVA